MHGDMICPRQWELGFNKDTFYDYLDPRDKVFYDKVRSNNE